MLISMIAAIAGFVLMLQSEIILDRLEEPSYVYKLTFAQFAPTILLHYCVTLIRAIINKFSNVATLIFLALSNTLVLIFLNKIITASIFLEVNLFHSESLSEKESDTSTNLVQTANSYIAELQLHKQGIYILLCITLFISISILISKYMKSLKS